ncbi:putative membrane protein [Nakamurella sp. UYEF19]|uniref:hypothetical protein n=1 Tax=Nakamurella sp. UYEF19 TaxID=1756392 RepID=UPI003391F396
MTTPSYPAAPMNTYVGGAAPQPVAPGTVKGAFLIYLLSAAVSVISVVLLVTSDTWNQVIATYGDQADAAGVTAASLIQTVKIFAIVAVVIFVGLYLLFAFKMRAGRNWARIVLTVLSVLSVANVARPASSSVTINDTTYAVGSTQAVGWAATALAIVAIVLMFMPASNAYMSASKAARPMR